MSLLGSRLSELESIQRSRALLESWIHQQEETVSEMLQRPAKLRPDAAQLEVNMATDMRQAVAEKQAALDDIATREEAIGAAAVAKEGEEDLKAALENLDEHVRRRMTAT